MYLDFLKIKMYLDKNGNFFIILEINISLEWKI